MSTGHSSILGSAQIVWPDEAACAAFAARLAAHPGVGRAFVALQGGLGAGKTTFVRHLLRALGVAGRIKSPTYTVMEPYELPKFTAWHFDFYRFNEAKEWEDAGFRDVFAAEGLKLVEWPQRAEDLLPTPDLRLDIAIDHDDRRVVRVTAFTPLGLELLS